MPLHKDLTGTDLHEPKGIASASSDTVYVANGSGTGLWQKIGTAQIDDSEVFLNGYSLSVSLADISGAVSSFTPIPQDWTLVAIAGVLNGALTGANSTLTWRKNGSAVIATQVIDYTTSAEGTSFQITGLANNTFVAGDYIKVSSDGGATTGAPCSITLVFERTS